MANEKDLIFQQDFEDLDPEDVVPVNKGLVEPEYNQLHYCDEKDPSYLYVWQGTEHDE